MLCVLEGPVEATHDEAFNIGAREQNFQVRDLAETVREVVPECEVEYAGSGDPDPRSYRVDFWKFARLSPSSSCRARRATARRRCSRPIARQGLTLADFEGERYTRLKRLRRLIDDGTLDADLRRLPGSRPPPSEHRGAGAGSVIFTDTDLPGAVIVDLDERVDERGFFARAWCAKRVRGCTA